LPDAYDFHDEDFAVLVLSLDVNAVVLLILVVLVGLAFDDGLYLALPFQYHFYKAFKDGKVSLVPQKPLYCVVETDEFVACHNKLRIKCFAQR
jgi:hypothetical protein